MERDVSLRPLQGLKVLDLTRFLSGPQTTLFLAALGAEVVKIDDPKTGDPVAEAPPFVGKNGVSMTRSSSSDVGLAFLKRARGKKSIELDLKSEVDKNLFLRLAVSADVIVENFRFGVTKRLGIDYEQVKKINSKIIYCSITGYGNTGPEKSKKAFDATVQAASGLMSVTGQPEGTPIKIGSSMADTIAGTFALSGILASLIQRNRTGIGEFIDVSMNDCLISLLYDEAWDCFDELGLEKRQGNRIMRFSPFNLYSAADGGIVFGAATEKDWLAITEMIGREDLKTSPIFSNLGDRIKNANQIDHIVSEWAAKQKVSDIIELCEEFEIPCSPVNDIASIGESLQMQERGILQKVQHPNFHLKNAPLAGNFPVKFTSAKTSLDQPAPKRNEHFEEVLQNWLNPET